MHVQCSGDSQNPRVFFSARRKKSRKSAIWLGQGDQGSTVLGVVSLRFLERVWCLRSYWVFGRNLDEVLGIGKISYMICWLTLLTQVRIISLFMINWSTTYSYSIHAFNSLELVVWYPSSFHESRDGNCPRSCLKKSSSWKDLTILHYNSTVKIDQQKYICWISLMGLIFWKLPLNCLGSCWIKLRLSTVQLSSGGTRLEGRPCFGGFFQPKLRGKKQVPGIYVQYIYEIDVPWLWKWPFTIVQRSDHPYYMAVLPIHLLQRSMKHLRYILYHTWMQTPSRP